MALQIRDTTFETRHLLISNDSSDASPMVLSIVVVLGYSKIAITTDHSISKVLLIELLDYNLLSVSQFCEMGYNYLFTNKCVTVIRRSDDSYAFCVILRGKIYLMNFMPEEMDLDKYLIAKTTMC
jgi:hypothetical protein